MRTFLLIPIILGGCLIKKVADKAEKPMPPTISTFTAEPLSVNEGDSVRLIVSGSGIENCDLSANGEALGSSFALKDMPPSHTPSQDTVYQVFCRGPGGQTEATVEVNIIVADDVIKTDLLSEIAKIFDIEAIKDLALKGFEGSELTDFKDAYEQSLLPKSEHFPLNVGESEVSVIREHSLLYGYEGNHDFSAYTKQCETLFEPRDKKIYQLARFDLSFDRSAKEHRLILPNKFHITAFEARTKSLENPIPKGTEWEVSFALSQTEVLYEELYQDFGRAQGLFRISGETIEPVSLPEGEKGFSSYALKSLFPEHYPIPPSVNGYQYDPSHETCRSSQPKISFVVSYNTVSEFCTSPFANQGCEDPGKRNLLPQKWPYTRLVELKGKPFDQYVEKFASRRVVSGPGTISCFEMFRSIANNFALGSDWTISYPNVQWFVYDDRWPSCGGYNCTGKIMRKSADDSFYSEVEPVKNYCIDRWKNDPWSSYESELLNACKNTETYKKAVSEAALNGAAEDMANACLKKEECKYLSNSISDLINEKLLISKLHSHVEAIKDKDQVAKNDRISYLIPSFDPYFSILNEIDRYISHLDSGYESLISIHMSTGAKWNLGMEKITGKSMPIGFQSPDELKETIEGYKRLILEMKNLSKNQIVTQTCSWSAVGGFRKFDGFRVNEIRRSNVEGSNKIEKFISIAPVEID